MYARRVELAFGAVVAIALVAYAIKRWGRHKQLEAELAVALGGEVHGSHVTGRAHGVDVAVVFTSRGTGSNSVSWTYYEATLPTGYPLILDLRAHRWRDRSKIAAGEMVDIVFEEPTFDDRFLVEGAPEAVLRRLLGPEVRASLLAERRDLDLTNDGETLRLAVVGWDDKSAPILAHVGTVAQLAARVREETLAVDQDTPLAAAGDAYRPTPDDSALQRSRAARAEEVARVTALQEARSARTAVVWGIAVIWIVVLIVVLVASVRV